MNALSLTHLDDLMTRTEGLSSIGIGFIDGPISTDHPNFSTANLKLIGSAQHICNSQTACFHATFIAGLLVGQKTSTTTPICPQCTLLVRPIFADFDEKQTSASPLELAEAIRETVDAGARLINLSAGLLKSTGITDEKILRQSLDYAARADVPIVAAAGNNGLVTASVITSHPGVIPVVACNVDGTPAAFSTVSHSIALRGLMAPGVAIKGLNLNAEPATMSGTSVAVPFVTGAIALYMSLFPKEKASIIVTRMLQRSRPRSIYPPLLDATISLPTTAN